MYEETGCFDPNSVAEGADDGFPQPVPNQFEGNLRLSPNELSYHHQYHYQQKLPPPQEDAAAVDAMELELQQHMAFNVENSANNNNNNNHLMPPVVHDPDQVLSYDHSNWSTEIHDVGFNEAHNQDDHHDPQQNPPETNASTNFNINNPSSLTETLYSQTPDLLNLFHLPRCLPNSSISFANHDSTTLGFNDDLPASDSASVLYDPLFHLNLPPQPQPPLFRELFQSMPHGYNLMPSRGGGNSLFGDERESSGVAYQDRDDLNAGQFDNRVLEFSSDMACIVRGGEAAGKITKHFATERQRRENLNDKYNVLKRLVPSPTKTDRASIVGDAIAYIKELLRTVNELKLLVEKKRCGRERSKRHKTEEDGAADGDVEKCNLKPLGVAEGGDQSYNGSLRSSWLQRKSKDTEVDVRIIDDEVTIKLVQRKKIDCLLFVSKVLEELQLDLHHVAGGHIGDYCSFLFNTKIYEGSSVYAGAIANKLIEVMDRQYAAVPPTSSY